MQLGQLLQIPFVAIGHDPRNELVRGQVELNEDGYVCVQHPTTAAGTDCGAALDAQHYLAGLVEAALGLDEVGVAYGVRLAGRLIREPAHQSCSGSSPTSAHLACAVGEHN